MVSVIFGIGASLMAIVGAYVGAGQREKAISIAWREIFINAAIVGCIGLLLSFSPQLWSELLPYGLLVNYEQSCMREIWC